MSLYKQKPVFDLQMDITSKCNLKCIHCPQKNNVDSGELNFEEWKIVLQQYFRMIEKLDCEPNILISGGEPLLSPILKDLILYIRENYNSVPVLLLSNGTLVSESLASFLSLHNVDIQISLDGYNELIHDAFRGSGCYEKIMCACDVLRKYNVKFIFQSILRRQVGECIESFFEVANRERALAMNFTRLIPNSTEEIQYMLSGSSLKKAYESILSASKKYNLHTDTNGPLWCLIDSNLGHPYSAGFLGLTVTSFGDIRLTSRVDLSIGNIKDNNSLEKLYYKNKIANKLRLGMIDGCNKCEYFMKCRGDRNISYVLHGNFFGPDEHCWHWIEMNQKNAIN